MALKHKIWMIAIGAIAVLALCGWLIYTRIETKDWAAWVQAVGSIAAIFFAVVLTWYQGEASLERERIKEQDDVRGLLLSIRDELSVSIEMAQQMVGNELERTQRGTAFCFSFPVQEDPFNIFNSIANRLPLIKDEVLRLQIVRTYGVAKGAIGTFRFNNELIVKLEWAWRKARKSHAHSDKIEAELIDVQMMEYGDAVRMHYAQVKFEIEELMSLLRERGL